MFAGKEAPKLPDGGEAAQPGIKDADGSCIRKQFLQNTKFRGEAPFISKCRRPVPLRIKIGSERPLGRDQGSKASSSSRSMISEYLMPEATSIFGYIEISVKPGSVFGSLR